MYDFFSGNNPSQLVEKAALFVDLDANESTAGAEKLQLQDSPAALREGEHHFACTRDSNDVWITCDVCYAKCTLRWR